MRNRMHPFYFTRNRGVNKISQQKKVLRLLGISPHAFNRLCALVPVADAMADAAATGAASAVGHFGDPRGPQVFWARNGVVAPVTRD